MSDTAEPLLLVERLVAQQLQGHRSPPSKPKGSRT
jgi:hypothetical protein